ncbi:MAG: photosynthetic complex assembly protein PuhC [Pseudomonadota bacterium]
MSDHALPPHVREAIARRGDREKVPRMMLRLIAVMLVLITSMVAAARIMGVEPVAQSPKGVPVVSERVIHLIGSRDGAVEVTDATGQTIVDLDSAHGGFVSVIWRAIARERGKHGVPAEEALRLIKFTDGRLSLVDTQIEWQVELTALGKENAETFARLLEK